MHVPAEHEGGEAAQGDRPDERLFADHSKEEEEDSRKLIEIPFEDFLFPYRFDESSHSLTKQGSIVTPVRTNVVSGEILGRTSWSNV